MTPDEFKNKTSSYGLKILKDWLGNTVKDGDTVIVFRTKPFICGDIKIVYLNSNKPPETIGHIPNNFIWEEKYEFIVKEIDGKLMHETKYNDIILIENIAMVNFWKQPSDVICIKGISDDKDMYINFIGGISTENHD